MVDTSSFKVSRNLAVTPGAVVLRTEVLELIQYRPQTAQVREVPLLIVSPTINKCHAMDLTPGRSLVEYLVQNGQQTFVISWHTRPPGTPIGGWTPTRGSPAAAPQSAGLRGGRVAGKRTWLHGFMAAGISSTPPASAPPVGSRPRRCPSNTVRSPRLVYCAKRLPDRRHGQSRRAAARRMRCTRRQLPATVGWHARLSRARRRQHDQPHLEAPRLLDTTFVLPPIRR